MIKLNDKFQKEKSVIAREEKNGYALYNSEDARFFQINDIAYDILNECNGLFTVKDIIEKISRDYKIDNHTEVESDILSILKMFYDFRIITKTE